MLTYGTDRSSLPKPLPSRLKARVRVGLALLVGGLICLPTPCTGKGDAPKSPANSKTPAGSAAVPGFRVPLPEISINRILGSEPRKKKGSPKKPESQPTSDEKPTLIEPDAETAHHPPPRKEPGVRRLPFEPLPVKPLHRPGTREGAKEKVPEEGSTRAVIGVPSAPEHPLEARPPRKALLKSKAVPKIPELLTAELAKEKLVPLHTEPEALQEVPTSDWIPIQPRQGMAVIPAAEPKPTPEQMPEPPPAAEPEPQAGAPPESTAPPELKPKTQPAPTEEPKPESAAPPAVEPPAQEPRPQPEIPTQQEFDTVPGPTPDALQPPDEPRHPSEETATVEELPEPAVVEKPVVSPLSDDLLENREVRDYVQATMPILEELSLLMTRVPTLSVEDFDPSDPNAPVVPSDIAVKMDSMKRQLQILDSKTFAIIPPQDFTQFHAMIRESITESYRACEAIVNFFNERNQEDLKRVREHLGKARSLIRKTMKRSG